MIYAPLPPPVGGIASIHGMLKDGMEKDGIVLFVKALGVSKSKFFGYIRPFANVLKIIINLFKIKRGGNVLFFSSAFTSFFEKLFWSLIVTIFGRKPILVMVDGNFPRFYESLGSKKKGIVDFLIKIQPKLIIGAQSEYWRDFYTKIFPNHLVIVVSASVDNHFFEISHTSNTEGKELLFLFIGWIIPEKGILDLLNAIQLKSNSLIGKANFKLIGPLFGKEDYWNTELENRKIKHLVNFAGPVYSRDSILKEFTKADVFIFPSHYEGFPVSLLEAITTGLPCIATSVGGIPDILDNGNAGDLVEPNSPEQLADKILNILNNPEHRYHISKNAYERARSSYDYNNLIESYSAILNLN